MKSTQLTKQGLQEKLEMMQQISLQTINRKGKYSSLAKRFLEDFANFSKVLNEIPDCKTFNVIDKSSKVYMRKEQLNILFDSLSIVLLQDNDEFYIYYIAKYKLK